MADPIKPGQVTSVPENTYDIRNELGKVVDNIPNQPLPTPPNLLLNNNAPQSGAINPAYAAYINVLKNSPVNTAANKLSTPYYTPAKVAEPYSHNSWGGYNPYDVGIDNWYGEQQGWFSQMGNRIAKLGVKALGSFAGSLMDIPNTINAVRNGSMDKMWDNPTNNWANNLMDWSEKQFPNYQTSWEKEHPFLNLIPFYGNAGNGWGNVLEQTGFTIGAIGGAILQDTAIGALTGGTGEIPLAAQQINKAVYNLGKLINLGDDSLGALKKSIQSVDDIVKGLKGIDRFNYAVRKGLWGANMITSGMSEAAFEGIDSYKTLSNDLQKQFYEQNGRLPNYEENQKIDGTARDAANSRFLLNTALLSVTNSIQWGNLLRPLNATKDLLEAEAKLGTKVALKEGSRDVFEAVDQSSKLAKWGRAIAHNQVASLLTESGSEGFEEGAQYVIERGVNDFYKRKYDGEAVATTNNFMKSFTLGLSDTLGTKEGWENIVYGLLGGAMYKAGEHAYYKVRGIEKPNYKSQIETVLQGLNSQSLTGVFENKYGEAVAAQSIQKDLQDAAQSGNTFLYKNYKHEQFVNFILSGIKQNKFDTRIQQLQELRKLDDDEFKKTFGIPSTTENRKSVDEYINKMEENAHYINDVHKRVSRTFINPFNYKGTGNYTNKQQAEKQNTENEKYIAFDGAKDQLIYSMAIAKDSSSRIGTIHEQLSNMQSVVSPQEATMLSSEEGLKDLKKDYKDKHKDLIEGLKLAKDAKSQRDADWYSKKVEDIDAILSEKDNTKQSALYNKFLGEVFDKNQKDKNSYYTTYGTENQQNAVNAPFPRDVIKDTIDLGRDMYHLQKRNEIAIKNYAHLTTKGGFKSLFDEVMDERKKIQDEFVALSPEPQQAPEQVQQQAAFNQSQIKQGQEPTAQPQNTAVTTQQSTQQNGYEEDLGTKELSPEEYRAFLNKVMVDILDGKYKPHEIELEELGFKTIDDIKFENPKADISQYIMVKSVSGRNYYIPKAMANQARENVAKNQKDTVAEFKKEDVTNVPLPTNPLENPPGPRGTEPLRSDDFLAKVFVPQDLKLAFNNAIFSGPKDEVRNNLSVSVRPLSQELQAAFDQQKAQGAYTPVKGFPGVFVAKAPIDLSLSHSGIEIGKIAYPERLLFDNGNKQLVTIDRISPTRYQQLTGRPAAQHAADVDEYRKQVAFKNYLALRYKNNGFNPITISPEELKDLVDINVTYGEYDFVTRDQDRPTFAQLKRNTVSIPLIGGGSINTMVILSVPKRYVSDTATRERTEFMNLIYGQDFYTNAQANDSIIREFINSNTEGILKIGTRYIGIVELPNGQYATVALRPGEMSQQAKDTLFQSIKERAALSAETNFREATKEDSDGVLLIGDQQVYYKLPSDEAKKFNDEFNTQLNNSLFISDINGKSWFNLSVSPIGAIRLEVHEPVSGYRTTLYISPQTVASLNSLSDMLDTLKREVAKREAKDAQFRDLGVSISGANFRQNIVDDAGIPNAEVLSTQVTASTTTEVLKNGTMRLVPNTGEVQSAYQKAGGHKAAQARPEQIEQGEQPIIPPSQQGEREMTPPPISPIEENPERDQISEIFGTQQSLAQAISSMQQLHSDTEGQPIIPETPSTPANQEAAQDVEYATVRDALNAFDIDYRFKADNTLEFFNISTGEPLSLSGMSPMELAKSMHLQIKEQEKPKGDEGFDFKLAENGLAELNRFINIEKAKTYIQSILPSFIQVKEISDVLDQLREQGIKDPEKAVWGAFRNSIIYLNKNGADIGTEYHEAFHAIFNTFVSPEEQQKLLKYATEKLYTSLKKDGKSIRQYITEQKENGLWKGLSIEQATNKAAEEWMAEEFRNWKNKKSDAGPLQKLFDLIQRFFKWMLRDGNDLDALFNKIDSGGFKYSSIASNSFTQETNDEYNNPDFKLMLIPARPGRMEVGKGVINVQRTLDPVTSTQVVQTVASYFMNYKKLDKFQARTDDQVLNSILDDLSRTYSVNNPLYAGWTQEQIQRLLNSDESFIYTDENSRKTIKEGAKKYINSMRYIEQFQEEEQEGEEQDAGSPSTGYDNRSENVGGFSSLPGMLRQYIGFSSYENPDKFGNQDIIGDDGQPTGVKVVSTVDSLSVYYGLLRAVANINDPVKFFQRMVRYTDGNEQARHFVEKLIKDTGLNREALFNENRLEATTNKALIEMVKKGFNKYRIDYVFTEYDVRKGSTKSYYANRKNVESVQFDKWSNSFINNYTDRTGDAQRGVRQAIDDIRNRYFDERRISKYEPERLNSAVSEIKNALNGVGVQLSTDYVKYSLLSAGANKFDELNKTLQAQGNKLEFDDAQNTFITKDDYAYVQIMKVADEISLTRDFMDELSKSLASGANPYFREIRKGRTTDQNTGQVVETEDEIDTAMVTRLLNVARGNAMFDETVGESSYTNAEGKVVYAHQDGTFNVKFSYSLRDANFRKQLREQGYREEATAYRDAYDAEWLTNNLLLKSDSFEAIADNLLFQRIDGLRAVETNTFGKVITQEFRDQKEGVTYGDFSPREFITNLMNTYISYSKTQKTSKGDVITAPHLIRVLEASKTADTVNLPIHLDVFRDGQATDKTANILLDEVKKEFNRIQRVQGEVGSITNNIVENYHTGFFAEDGYTVTKGYRGLKFTDNMTSLLSNSTVEYLERKARSNEPITEQDESRIKEDVKNSLNRLVDDTIDVLAREGIIHREANGRYTNILLHRDFMVGNTSLNLQSVDSASKFRTNIGHVIINDYINTLAYNQILHGDSALSLKNDGGVDAVKRAKGDNAAIVSIRTDLSAPELGITKPFTHSSVAIFKEPIADSPIAKGIKVADAQMYTTVEGLRYTLWGLGRLTPRLANFLNTLENGGDIHNIEYETTNRDGDKITKNFDGVFDKNNGIDRWNEMTNSLKLVYKDGKNYFKMSVVILQPTLTSYKDEKGEWKPRPGWETLHNLRTKMEGGGIHFSAPESASKMMTMDVSKAKDFSDLKGHLFDNNYFGLQTENPSNKLTITTPTQLLQLIDSEQDDDVEVNYQGQDMSVGQLKRNYQTFIAQVRNNAYDIAKQEIYHIEDLNQEVDKSIAEGKVTPRLARFQARAVDTLETSGSDAQLLDFFSLDENGNPKFNLNMSSTKAKFQQLYLSYFSKGILSQKNPGYTVALFSGIDTKTIRKATHIEDGVVTQWEHVRREHWDTNYDNIRNERILPSRGHVSEIGQYYVDELQHNVPEFDENGKITGYYSEYMLPAHYKEFLDIPRNQDIPEAISKGFGVRIPSQDKHSFISLKLIDFLPANLGSTGMFPKELIALSGADFDIDKLFISRYDFYMNKDARGNIQFKKYGDASTIEGKWEEYKNWMGKNNKAVKGLIKDIAANDTDYQQFVNKDEDSIDVLDEVFGLETAERLKRKYFDNFTTQALAQLNLPSTLEQFEEMSKSKELNNGVLNNKIVDAYIALLTNKGMQDIAKTPATLTALDNIQRDNDITLRDENGNILGSVFGKKTNSPVDSLAGKYYSFKNNTTGKNNIGIDVNANLIYSILNKANIQLHGVESGLTFDNKQFNSFAGNREYNLQSGEFDGRRTNDILSTLITSATDEAKEQLNALYNLSVDALKVVNYMVALKVPLKTAIYFVNQPSIRNYLDIKAVKQNTLQTTQEEKLFKKEFREAAIAKTGAQIKDYTSLSNDDLFSMMEKNSIIEVKCD